MAAPMIVLLTDFGIGAPYVGQMKAALHREAPGVPVIDLFHDLPAFDPRAAAFLLAAYQPDFPPGSVFLCVVDPGVGGDSRLPLALWADTHWYVGPDNGLFEIVARRAGQRRHWRITWQPQRLSASFHGRDIFAPVAARLASGAPPPGEEQPEWPAPVGEWPDDLARIIYIDNFGNAITGLRAGGLKATTRLAIKDRTLPRARTFSNVPRGEAFWYENANGLAEIAVNQGRAADLLGLAVGQDVRDLDTPRK